MDKDQVDGQVHQCELLEIDAMYMHLIYPGTEYQRWVLKHHSHFRQPLGSEEDPVHLQMAGFCPGCGMDFRKDLHWQIGGKPHRNEIMNRAREEGEKAGALA